MLHIYNVSLISVISLDVWAHMVVVVQRCTVVVVPLGMVAAEEAQSVLAEDRQYDDGNALVSVDALVESHGVDAGCDGDCAHHYSDDDHQRLPNYMEKKQL